jgi:anthranilate phosphoribosyltransferase
MRDNWMTGIYDKIKRERDARLAQVLAILRPKAVTDAEIATAVELLEPWAPAAPPQAPRPDTTAAACPPRGE